MTTALPCRKAFLDGNLQRLKEQLISRLKADADLIAPQRGLTARQPS